MNSWWKIVIFGLSMLLIISVYSSTFSVDVRALRSNLDDKHIDVWSTYQHDAQHTGRSKYYLRGNSVRLKWAFNTSGSIYQPIVDGDGNIYIISGKFWEFWGYNGTLYSLFPNGTLRWEINLSSPGPPAMDSNHTIYIPCEDGLYAINSNGTVKWIFKTEGTWINNAAPVVYNGVIYVTSSECCILNTTAHLYAIYLNGTLKWEIGLNGKTYVSPAIGRDGTIYVSSGRDLYAISSDGNLKWIFHTESNLAQSTPVVGDDDTIYIASSWLFAVSPNGTLKWKHPLDPKRYDFGKPPAIDERGCLYVPSNGSVLCISPDGKIKWTFKTASNDIDSPVIDSKGTIYVAADKVYALDPNGTVKWNISGRWWYSAISIGDNSIYIFNGTLWAFAGYFEDDEKNTLSDGNYWSENSWWYMLPISIAIGILATFLIYKRNQLKEVIHKK